MLNTFQFISIYEADNKAYCTKGYVTEIDEDEIVQYENETGIDYCSIDEIISTPNFTGVEIDGLLEVLV